VKDDVREIAGDHGPGKDSVYMYVHRNTRRYRNKKHRKKQPKVKVLLFESKTGFSEASLMKYAETRFSV